MRRTRRGTGFTLLEVLISAGILGVVLASTFDLFSAGNRAVVKGISTTGLVSSALVLEQNLMHDLQQMMVPDKDPVTLDLSGTYLSFFTPDRTTVQPVFKSERKSASTTQTWAVTGAEIRWHLVDAPHGYFHPIRNDKVFSDVWLKTWRWYDAKPGMVLTTGTSQEVDLSAHPLTPELRQKLGFPPAKLPPPGRAGSAPATPPTTSHRPTPPTTSAGSPKSTSSTPSTTSSTSTPTSTPSVYLMLEYTMVDPERKSELKRSLVWDLVNVRSKQTFGGLYVLPPGIITVRPRREIKKGAEETFDAKWEKQPK